MLSRGFVSFLGALAALCIAAAPASAADGLVFDHFTVDNTGPQTHSGKWSEVNEASTHATYTNAGLGISGTYDWDIPKTIPAAGAKMTLTAHAEDTTGNRMYAYMGVNGTYGSPGRVEMEADADFASGVPTKTVTKEYQIVPSIPGAGQTVYLTLKLGPEGPLMTYYYRADDGGGGGCRAVPRRAAGSCPAPGVVTLTGLQKHVEFQDQGGPWQLAKEGTTLRKGDRLHTGFKAGVTVTFSDGSKVQVGPMTLIEFDEVNANGLRARLIMKTGEVKAQVNRSTGAYGDFETKTPTTTASVRGTSFSVAYDGTATTVAVTESSVEVTANSGATVTVPAGMETRSTADAVDPPAPIGQGFESGGLSSAEALALVSKKVAGDLKKCKLDVASDSLAPTTGGWSAELVIVKAKDGIDDKPKGTAKYRLKGKKLTARNGLARKIGKGCQK